MTCDPGRPCKRCIQRGLDQTCEDAPRKRKKYLDDVPNSSLTIKRTQSLPQDPRSSHELQHGYSLNTSLQKPDAQNMPPLGQNTHTFLDMQTRLQLRQSNERDQQVPLSHDGTTLQQEQQPQLQLQHQLSHQQQVHPHTHSTTPHLARPASTFQDLYQVHQQPQRPQLLPQPNNFIPNHTTYQATLFQHNALGLAMQSAPDYYFHNSFNQSRQHSQLEHEQPSASSNLAPICNRQRRQRRHHHHHHPNNQPMQAHQLHSFNIKKSPSFFFSCWLGVCYTFQYTTRQFQWPSYNFQWSDSQLTYHVTELVPS